MVKMDESEQEIRMVTIHSLQEAKSLSILSA